MSPVGGGCFHPVPRYALESKSKPRGEVVGAWELEGIFFWFRLVFVVPYY